MNIRSATAQDEPATIALWQACGLTAPHNDPVTDFRFALGKPSSDIPTAEEAGIIGGTGTVWIFPGIEGVRGRG